MKVKGIRQRDASDCGPACLAFIAAWYGSYVNVAHIRDWAGTDAKGTSVAGMKDAAGKVGLHLEAVRCSPGALQQMQMPAIAHVARNGLTHFVVLLSADDQKVNVMDPSNGEYSTLSTEVFVTEWSGVLLLITRSGAFRQNKRVSLSTKLFQLIRPHKGSMIAAVVCAIVYTAISLSLTAYLQQVVDKVVDQRNTGLLLRFSVFLIVLLLVQFIAGFVKGRIVLKTSQTIDRSLVMNYCTHVLSLPKVFHDKMRTGEILSRVSDAMRINIFINEILINFIIDGLTILMSVFVMLIYNWKLAFMVMTILPFYAILYTWNDRVNKRWQLRILRAGAEVDGVIVQMLQNVSTVKQLGLETYAASKIRRKLDELLYATGYSGKKQIMIISSTDLTTRVLVVCIICIATFYIFNGELTKGELLSFFALTSFFTTPAISLMSAGRHIRDTTIAADRLFEILELEAEQQSRYNMSLPQNEVSVEFSNVFFRYGNAEPVLRNTNLVVKRNSITGIKGASGCGKTTLTALLMKLYEPLSGEIFINGTELKQLCISEVRQLVSIVPQHTQLFNTTIRENICFDRKDVDEQKLAEIMEKTGVADFCRCLPLGVNTVVVEQGSNLSGGQRQKISLARALLRDAPILILDEPTAALDASSEWQIMQTIDWYRKKGNTVIIISHSDTALKICDNIVIL